MRRQFCWNLGTSTWNLSEVALFFFVGDITVSYWTDLPQVGSITNMHILPLAEASVSPRSTEYR
jgi:hypothetical protein